MAPRLGPEYHPYLLIVLAGFLNVGGERDKPGAPTCQVRVRTEVGPGTEARAKVQLIVELWPRRAP